mmetsp:Transcript_82960/g.232498  ORF Transcript_82960/g.232498 Transcript_82960/m.232498 type:complete len:239 (+) Transcript_82960:82-798(+)
MAPTGKLKGKKGKKTKESAAGATASPKASPALAPKAAPAAGGAKSAGAEAAAKAKSQKDGPPPIPPLEVREAATTRAIAMIKRGLEKEGAQETGHPYIPGNWSKEFKPVLGPYRKFVQTCGHFKIVDGDIPSNYTIHPVKGEPVTIVAGWETQLRTAWETYVTDTPEKSRSTKEFLEVVEKCVQRAKSAKETANGDGSQKKEPSEAPKKAGKRKEAEAAAAEGEASKPPMKKKKKAAA